MPRLLSDLRVAAGVLLGSWILAANPAAQPEVTVVMSGLDNPRGLAFGPVGDLYVVEAGRGGEGPCVVFPIGERCYGPSGAVTRLWRGVQERLVSGLPSHALPNGQEATGPHDISFHGRGGAYVTIGWGGNPALRDSLGAAGALFGTLVHISAGGAWRAIADVSAFEQRVNPAGGPVDSNPFGVLAGPAARVVVDAGANSLLRVAANGEVSALATFPSRPLRVTDAVPTSVAVGPDGAYYVGELTGLPFAEGAARVYRIEPGGNPQVYLEGFQAIIDLTFGPDANLYVLQHGTGPMFFSGPGQLIRVEPDGTRTVVVDGLSRPTSVVIDDDGTIYVTNHGIEAGTGEVLKVEP